MKYLISGALACLILTAAVIWSGGAGNLILPGGVDYFEKLGGFDNLDIKILSVMFGANATANRPPEPNKYIWDDVREIPPGKNNADSRMLPPDKKNGGEIIISVLDYIRGEVYSINLEEYLVGVVFSEMPASFELEALKAQAVAARSYSVYKMLYSGEAEREYHLGADICSDARHCKAYLGKEEAFDKYGGIEYFWQIIKLAVSETAGEIITYKSEPAIAVFHAMSANITESAENIWGRPVPYLIAVQSEESNNIYNIRNFETEIKLSSEEFKSVFTDGGLNLDFAGNQENWIEYISLNSSGRVDYIIICGEKISGVRFRSLFALRSTDFTVEAAQSGGFIFTVYGYGHGVGMSQYGANLMALDGSSYTDILKWYYTGVEIDCADLFFD